MRNANASDGYRNRNVTNQEICAPKVLIDLARLGGLTNKTSSRIRKTQFFYFT